MLPSYIPQRRVLAGWRFVATTKPAQLLAMHTDRASPAVFLSHAGAQKRIFVDYIYSSFTGSGISVFLDQHSLDYGRAQEDMRSAVAGCCVGELSGLQLPPSKWSSGA
jgi:hypothetical protein